MEDPSHGYWTPPQRTNSQTPTENPWALVGVSQESPTHWDIMEGTEECGQETSQEMLAQHLITPAILKLFSLLQDLFEVEDFVREFTPEATHCQEPSTVKPFSATLSSRWSWTGCQTPCRTPGTGCLPGTPIEVEFLTIALSNIPVNQRCHETRLVDLWSAELISQCIQIINISSYFRNKITFLILYCRLPANPGQRENRPLTPHFF